MNILILPGKEFVIRSWFILIIVVYSNHVKASFINYLKLYVLLIELQKIGFWKIFIKSKYFYWLYFCLNWENVKKDFDFPEFYRISFMNMHLAHIKW